MSLRQLVSSTVSAATLVLVAALFITSCVSGGGYGSGATASGGGGGNGCQAGYCNSNGYCCPPGECGCNYNCYSGSGYLSAGCTTCKTVC